MLGQYLAFVIAGYSTPLTFYIFYNNTTVIPTEITSQILGYIVVDAQPLTLSGCVKNYTIYYLVVLVLRVFCSIYLNYPYSSSTKSRETMLVKVCISEALKFCDLRTLVAFFEDGPS